MKLKHLEENKFVCYKEEIFGKKSFTNDNCKIFNFYFKDEKYEEVFNIMFNFDINFEKYNYINFTNNKINNVIFEFLHRLHHCYRITEHDDATNIIKKTGYFDIRGKYYGWSNFQNDYLPLIYYSFEQEGNNIYLKPSNLLDNPKIAESSLILTF